MTTGWNRGSPSEPDAVRLYLGDIGRYALLTKAEEVTLAQAIEAGRGARDCLVRAGSTTAETLDAEARVRAGERRPPSSCEPTSAGRVDRPQIPGHRYTAGRPDPGREPGADPRSGEVRLAPRLQVLDLHDVVDTPGDDAGMLEHRPPDPPAGPRCGPSRRVPTGCATSCSRGTGVRLPPRSSREALDVAEPYLVALLVSAGAVRSLSESPVGRDDTELGDVLADRGAVSPADAATEEALASELDGILVAHLDVRERAPALEVRARSWSRTDPGRGGRPVRPDAGEGSPDRAGRTGKTASSPGRGGREESSRQLRRPDSADHRVQDTSGSGHERFRTRAAQDTSVGLSSTSPSTLSIEPDGSPGVPPFASVGDAEASSAEDSSPFSPGGVEGRPLRKPPRLSPASAAIVRTTYGRRASSRAVFMATATSR